MHSFHQFQELFGAFIRKPVRVPSEWGGHFIIVETATGAYAFGTLAELRYCVAIETLAGYEPLPF